ncbi:MAG: DUF4199 domain-containing protein [Flavipsychrobacter sp.]
MELKQTHKQYGLITGLAMMVIGLILYVLDLSFESWTQYVVYLPFLLGLILNANAFSKANNGYVTFGQTFSSCFKAVAIITIIGVAWALLSFYIFPEMVDKAIEAARERMIQQGNTDEEIEMGMKFMTGKYLKIVMIGSVMLMYMIVGAIFSLIAAATAKKNGPMPPSMQAE